MSGLSFSQDQWVSYHDIIFLCCDKMFLCRDRVGNGGEALCHDKVRPNGEVLCCDRAILCCDIVGQVGKIFCCD